MMIRAGPRGIGLVEVLFVILILGLLTAVVIPRFVYSGEVKTDECKANVALMNAKLDHYVAGHPGKRFADAGEAWRLLAADKETFANGLPKCPYDKPYDYDPNTGHIVEHHH